MIGDVTARSPSTVVWLWGRILSGVLIGCIGMLDVSYSDVVFESCPISCRVAGMLVFYPRYSQLLLALCRRLLVQHMVGKFCERKGSGSAAARSEDWGDEEFYCCVLLGGNFMVRRNWAYKYRTCSSAIASVMQFLELYQIDWWMMVPR